MAGNSIGQVFRVMTAGESHGIALTAIVDGVPPGIALCEADFIKSRPDVAGLWLEVNPANDIAISNYSKLGEIFSIKR